MAQSELIQQGVFLDTNALHYLRVYFDVADKCGLKPSGTAEEWSEIGNHLKTAQILPGQQDSIKHGFDTFCYLLSRAAEDDRIVVSRLTLAEIIHGLVEGQAHLRMAEAGMPFRMRQSGAELKRALTAWMSASGFGQVRMATDSFIGELQKQLHVQIRGAADNSNDRDILTLLESVLQWVYFDVIDAWLYAECLIEQVSRIVTFDAGFRNTINWIYNPGSAPQNDEHDLWKQTRSAIQSAVASVLLVPADKEDEVVIPQGIRPGNSG